MIEVGYRDWLSVHLDVCLLVLLCTFGLLFRLAFGALAWLFVHLELDRHVDSISGLGFGQGHRLVSRRLLFPLKVELKLLGQ